MPFKTAMQYENGVLVHTQIPKNNDPSVSIHIVSITGAIDMLIRQFVTEKITGVLYIEVTDIRENPNNISIDFDINPKGAIPQVERAVDLFYKNRRKSG